MNTLGKVIITFAVAGALIGAGAAVAARLAGQEKSGNKQIQPPEKLPVIYYDQSNWLNGQRLASQAATASWPTEKIYGSIVPHDIQHLEYAFDVIQHLARQNVSTIVIIGPNHYERGAVNILTADIAWSTPKGLIKQNSSIIRSLLDKYGVQSDPTVIQGDHSVTGIMPVIAQFMPNARIIPLILKAETSTAQISSLALGLGEILPQNSAVIASVDFSHYLSAEEAAAHDKITAKLLTGLDSSGIMSFGTAFNDYVDSPASISLLFELMKNFGSVKSVILANTNSGLLANNMSVPVTSYFEMVYYR